MKMVGTHIKHIRIMRTDQNRRLPIPAVGPFAQGVFRGDVGAGVRFLVNPVVVAVLVTYVGRIVVARVDLHLHPVTAKQALVGVAPFLVPSGTCLVVVWADPGPIVLQTTVNPVAVRVVVHVDGVELAQGWGIGL